MDLYAQKDAASVIKLHDRIVALQESGRKGGLRSIGGENAVPYTQEAAGADVGCGFQATNQALSPIDSFNQSDFGLQEFDMGDIWNWIHYLALNEAPTDVVVFGFNAALVTISMSSAFSRASIHVRPAASSRVVRDENYLALRFMHVTFSSAPTGSSWLDQSYLIKLKKELEGGTLLDPSNHVASLTCEE